MKIQVSILFYFIFIVQVQSQTDQVRFSECLSGCNTGTINDPLNGSFSYDSWEQFSSIDVVSDYGMRNCSNCSNWHIGIDYSSKSVGLQNDDRGDALLAINSGYITRLLSSAQDKYLVVSGASNYGYQHLFKNGLPRNELNMYMKSGKFVLKQCDPPYEMHHAIINLETCTAYSDFIGAEVTLPGLSSTICSNTLFYTTTEVVEDEEIGPMGNSAAVAVHLHLYKFKSSAGSHTSSPISSSNSGDPLENVIHDLPSYFLHLSTLTSNNSVDVTYPGTKIKSIRVRPTMVGATTSGERIVNGVMNIDKVEIIIKPGNDMPPKLIIGPYYDSKIHLGGSNNSSIYPSVITGRYGSWTKTGQYPFAYSNPGNQLYDDFYFSDILTRIHKDDSYGKSKPKIAYLAEDARYPDGKYKIQARAIDVRKDTFPSIEYDFDLDNFMPYIRSVAVSMGPGPILGPVRTASRVGSQNKIINQIIDFNIENPSPLLTEVEVVVSEPLSELTMTSPLQSNIAFTSQDELTYLFNISLGDLPNEQSPCFILSFEGKDLSDNQLLDIYNLSNQNGLTAADAVTIPTRKKDGSAATDWTPTLTLFGQDQVEKNTL